MFAKPSYVAFLALVIGHVAQADARQSRCPGWAGNDDTTISQVLLADDTAATWAKPCGNDECRASRELICAADAYAHRLTPNTMAYDTPREARQASERYGRNIQALGQEHPGRIPLYCRLLARVAATITGRKTFPNGSPTDRDWTAYNVTDMAVRLDRPGNKCLAGVVAATPDTPAAQEQMADARDCLARIRWCQRHLNPPLR